MAERQCALPGCEQVVLGKRQTCSAAHRQAWNRLKKRAKADYQKTGAAPLPLDGAESVAQADPVELAIEVFKQELSPHVRAAITEDTIKAVRSLVTLTPQLVESLGRDLANPDPVARGRSQALVAKYTLGFLDPDKEAASRPLTINLGNMPTPGEPLPDLTPEVGETVQQCERCEEHKPLSDFEPGAPRCNECQAEIRAAIRKQYDQEDEIPDDGLGP